MIINFKHINLLKSKQNSQGVENKSSFKNQVHLDRKLVSSLNKKKIPSFKQLKQLSKVLSAKEKKTIFLLIALVILSAAAIGTNFYLRNFLKAPTFGGTYTEGLIGAPQYINPLLSQTNDVDSDISKLIYSGLLKYDNNLQLINDLAEKWEVSEDQKEYTFVIKENLKWQDGQVLTADDILFTISSIQDPDFKSPLLISFRGVKVEKIDRRTVKFILPDPYPSFLEVLTFGILPEHIWGEIPPINANLTEYNLKPVGNGPWIFKSLTKDKLGNIKAYTLEPNPEYHGQKAYLEKIVFKFYPDFQTGVSALKNHSVEGLSFLPKELKKDLAGQKNLKFYSFYLPQYTAIFFNQPQNEVLKEKNVRKALAISINKSELLSKALQLEGEIIDGPILPGDINYSAKTNKTEFDLDGSNQLLDESGWIRITPKEYQEFLLEQERKILEKAAKEASEELEDEENNQEEVNEITTEENTETEIVAASSTQEDLFEQVNLEPEQPFYRKKNDKILEITLKTVDQPENVSAAELIKNFWQSIGVKVNLEIVPGNKISREIIKPRNYDALLFGIIVGSDPDPYPFWHSSQNQDPGLNLSVFANRNVDKLLEDARKTEDEAEGKQKYIEFQEILHNEIPAIFLYNPTYTYVVDEKIKGINIERIVLPVDRFNNLADWYIKTRRVYKGLDLGS